MIYAPGAYTGYGVKTIPTVHEPMDAKKWAQAEAGVPAAAKAIEDEAKVADSAAEEVESCSARRRESRLSPIPDRGPSWPPFSCSITIIRLGSSASYERYRASERGSG